MGLDIRLPIGSMFLFVGVLLTIYGTVRPLASVSVGINVNLIWGIVLLICGIVMVLLGRYRSRGAKGSEVSSAVPARRGH